MVDYTIEDILYRDGGVSIIVNITKLDKDIYVNNSIEAFNRMNEYEVKRLVEESVKRFLECNALANPPAQLAAAVRTHADEMRDKLKGAHTIDEDKVKKDA